MRFARVALLAVSVALATAVAAAALLISSERPGPIAADDRPTATPAPLTPDITIAPSPTFGGWTGGDGEYTIIIEAADNLTAAKDVAGNAQDRGLTVGILNSDDFASLAAGYTVVFSGAYASRRHAEEDLNAVRDDFPNAYIRQVQA